MWATFIHSLTPPTRPTSGWRISAAPLAKSSLKPYLVYSCSPVAIGIFVARVTAANPSISSARTGSSKKTYNVVITYYSLEDGHRCSRLNRQDQCLPREHSQKTLPPTWLISYLRNQRLWMRTPVQNINPVLLINSQAGNIPERPILRKLCPSILAIPVVT